jgi:hypothetical protein
MPNRCDLPEETVACPKTGGFKIWSHIFSRPSIGTTSPAQIIGCALLFVLLVVLLMLRTRHTQRESYFSGTATADKLANSWETNHKLLAAYEQEQSKLRAAVIEKRSRYGSGEISKSEVVQAEQSLVAVLTRIQELRRLMAEAELAIAETEMQAESAPTATLSSGGLGQTNGWVPYRPGEIWSLKQARGIETYFYQTFGHNLPVSAFGQTATHDRLGFDHRDAMDIAVHPDSIEGKTLINYLRRSHIPFIAFRSAVARSATGAHIHVGRPSRRVAVKLSYSESVPGGVESQGSELPKITAQNRIGSGG